MNEFCAELSHPLQATAIATCKEMNFIMTGKFQPCEDCAVDKTNQSNVSKQPVEWSKVKGKRLFIDISSPSAKSVVGKCYLLVVLDDCSDNAWSYF